MRRPQLCFPSPTFQRIYETSQARSLHLENLLRASSGDLGACVGRGGGPLQHLPENITSLVHGFAGDVVFGGVDVNRLAADDASVFRLGGTGYTVPRRGGLFSDGQKHRSDGHNGTLLLDRTAIGVERHGGRQLSEVIDKRVSREPGPLTRHGTARGRKRA
jgi:hypothetical protein